MNSKPSFNLLNEPWIPTATATGGIEEVSLRDALLRAPQLGEVRCSSPLATVAVIRLLLAVLYRACPPATRDDWAALWQAGKFPEDKLNAYFAKWEDRFDLFSESRPFLQIGGMSMNAAGSVAQLATEVAAGNNPTLFDHACDEEPQALSAAQAARTLLASQAFALGFGKAASATVSGDELARPYFADGICLRGVTLWLSGRNLFECLTLNLVPGSESNIGLAIWEQDNQMATLDKVVDGKRVAKSANGIADRYVWLSRMILLVPDQSGTVRSAYFTQGREADKSMGDPMKVFTQSNTEGVYALGLNAGKAAWRDLSAYLTNDVNLRCPILAHANDQVYNDYLNRDATFGLNVVGLATDPGKAGKFLLWRHERVNLPAAVLVDEDAHSRLNLALSDAEYVAKELGERVRSVARKFLPPEGNPDPKDVDNLVKSIDPRPTYWARMEAHFQKFIADMPSHGLEALEAWRESAAREAQCAFREAVGRLGESQRALMAIAQVSDFFCANEQEDLQRKAAGKRGNRKKGDQI